MQKAWSSISELLWHGNEGGWGDASSSREKRIFWGQNVDPKIYSLEMKITPPALPPPPPGQTWTLFKINLVFSPVFQYFALPGAFLQPRGSIFWILGAQKSTSAAQGKHILDSGTLADARKLWPRPPLRKWPPHASSQCCRRPRNPQTRGQGRPKLAERGAQKSFSKIKRGSESPWTWLKGGLVGRSRSRSSSSCKRRSRYRLKKEARYFASAEMQKAWSSISELLWHGNEGGWGDASYVSKSKPREGKNNNFGPKDLLSRDEN